MAKQIKIIQCPQCGSTKPEQIKPDYYRCDKCGTQFFLDNDDININVNHKIPRDEAPRSQPLKGLWIVLAIIAVTGVIFLTRLCTSAIRYAGKKVITHKTYETPQSGRNKYLFSMLPATGRGGIVLYMENKGSKDSTTVVFRNVVDAQVVNEHNIGQKVSSGKQVAHRFFTSDSTDYLIVNQKHIYRVDPDNYSLTDVTGAICSRKPALEDGIMSAGFVDERTGEGFRVNTNLGKELFFFPAADVLCTEKACKFMATDPKGILPEAKNQVYYLFLNQESSHSSNVARLMEITYLFNDGGPENKLQEISGGGISNPEQHRIVSSKAITEERVCFSPAVLYSDNLNILVSFRPTLAPDAVVNVQLLNTSGNIVWTVAFTSDFRCTQAVRTERGFLLQISENNFWEISNNGEDTKNYNF